MTTSLASSARAPARGNGRVDGGFGAAAAATTAAAGAAAAAARAREDLERRDGGTGPSVGTFTEDGAVAVEDPDVGLSGDGARGEGMEPLKPVAPVTPCAPATVVLGTIGMGVKSQAPVGEGAPAKTARFASAKNASMLIIIPQNVIPAQLLA